MPVLHLYFELGSYKPNNPELPENVLSSYSNMAQLLRNNEDLVTSVIGHPYLYRTSLLCSTIQPKLHL